MNKSRKDWVRKLDDVLQTYRTAFNMLLEMSPYQLVYEKKLVILLVEIEHKAYWSIKEINIDFNLAGGRRLLQFSNQRNTNYILMRMSKFIKIRSNIGMIIILSLNNLRQGKKRFYTTHALNCFQENLSRDGRGHLKSFKSFLMEQWR